MYIRTVKNSKGQSYYHLVESYWEDGKSKKRTLMSLGRIEDNKLEDLAEAIGRHQNLLTATQLAKEISIEKTFILGPLLILEKLFEKLGINKAIEEVLTCHPRVRFDFQKILFTLVASRFVQPGSKLKTYEQWQKSFYPEMLEPNLELHQIYRALDLLSSHKEDIESSLYWHDRDLLNQEVDVVLYDLTTLRFESTRTDLGDLRQFGYSKENRSDCTQIVFGLLVDKEGIPLGLEVYPGNTFEGRTLSSIVEKMRGKFKVRRFIFVADRGLFSKTNLEELERDKGEFIVGMKLGVFKQRHEEFYNIDNFATINEELKVYETAHEGKRLIITWSRKRAERDKKVREDILSKLERKLSSTSVKSKAFVTNSNYKKYVTLPEDIKTKPVLNKKAIEEESKKDGFFGIVTNVQDIDAKEIIFNYKELWKIEDAFGEIKGNLKARPVFHWTDHRIVGHLVVCFIAYLCEAQLTKKLREKNLELNSNAIDKKIIKPRQLTVVEAMRELNEVRAIPVKVRGQTIWTRTDITGNAAKIFRAAEVGIPKKVLKLIKNPGSTN